MVPSPLVMSMRIVFRSLNSQEVTGEGKAATDETGCTVRTAEVIAMKMLGKRCRENGNKVRGVMWRDLESVIHSEVTKRKINTVY